MMKRKSRLVVLTAIMSLGALKTLVDEVALREAEEGEGWTGVGVEVVKGEEVEDGSKVGEGEALRGEEEEVEREGEEVWRGGVGELKVVWTEGGEEVGWKEEVGEIKVAWTEVGEEGAEVEWRVAWKVEEEAGVGLTEEVGLGTWVGVVVFQGVGEEGLIPLYLCSTTLRRCPIHQGLRGPMMNLKLQEMMTRRKIPLRLGGERKVRTVVREEGVGEVVEAWKRPDQVGAVEEIQVEIGEVQEEVEVVREEVWAVLEEIEVVLEEEWEVLAEIEVVLVEVWAVLEEVWEALEEIEEVQEEVWEVLEEVEEEIGRVMETGDHQLVQEMVVDLLIGFAQTLLASRIAMVQTRLSVLSVGHRDLERKEPMRLNLSSISL